MVYMSSAYDKVMCVYIYICIYVYIYIYVYISTYVRIVIWRPRFARGPWNLEKFSGIKGSSPGIRESFWEIREVFQEFREVSENLRTFT